MRAAGSTACWQVMAATDKVPMHGPVPAQSCCSKIAEAEAGVSVNEKKWLVMHVHVQMLLDELWGPPNPWLTVT
jgi:hypothetical protein